VYYFVALQAVIRVQHTMRDMIAVLITRSMVRASWQHCLHGGNCNSPVKQL
jgi:hypothetical protein